MADIKSPRLLYIKGALMLGVGILASLLQLVFVEQWNTRAAVLHCIAIWGFCRAYYFAFYVIEHYIDPGYRYAGLIPFVKKMLSRN